MNCCASYEFVKEHWDESKLKRCSIIVGVGQDQTDDNSEWLFRADLDEASQVQLNIPTTVNQEIYTIVGSDCGIICLQLARPGNRSRLLEEH
ncbi:hypothetical protein PIB30_095270 [Stylosanthes scabra]|uniref:Uncharacterized protein n=1 Tax=Stylosanthes scabra TaxID=79078 RepID=A0ABU6TVB9_9FABA|nr:hypothetical protein [Stylosanthes scabra]